MKIGWKAIPQVWKARRSANPWGKRKHISVNFKSFFRGYKLLAPVMAADMVIEPRMFKLHRPVQWNRG